MYKMIIVDDEKAARESIRNSFRWNEMNIEIVGEAVNGLEALETCKKLTPDILICDIRMPKLDGISFLNRIQPYMPNMQVIFMSAYSDVDYLRNAIRLEAVDYIFKPYVQKELVEAVEKAKRNCANRVSTTSTKDNTHAYQLLRYPEIDPEIGSLPLDYDGDLVSVEILINMHIAYERDNDNRRYLTGRLVASRYYDHFYSKSRDIFGDRFVLSCTDSGYLIHANTSETTGTRDRLRAALTGYFDLTGKQRDRISVSHGEIVCGISDLNTSFEQVCLASSATFLQGYGCVISYYDLAGTAFARSKQDEDQFFNNIISNNFTPAMEWLKNYFDYLRTCRVEDIGRIKDSLAELLLRLLGLSEGVISQQSYNVSSLMAEAEDLAVLETLFVECVDRYIEEISNLDNNGRIVFEVNKYINENFEGDLSIEVIAQHVYLTSNYLCYLYKQTTGMTINQYILSVRMEKSINYLQNTQVKIGEIAALTGYSNQNYFTKVFTKYYGKNPSQFRSQNCG